MTKDRLTDAQQSLAALLKTQCDKRGWFFFNPTTPEELHDIRRLEEAGIIEIQDRNVRIDFVSGIVKAGEIIGVVL